MLHINSPAQMHLPVISWIEPSEPGGKEDVIDALTMRSIVAGGARQRSFDTDQSSASSRSSSVESIGPGFACTGVQTSPNIHKQKEISFAYAEFIQLRLQTIENPCESPGKPNSKDLEENSVECTRNGSVSLVLHARFNSTDLGFNTIVLNLIYPDIQLVHGYMPDTAVMSIKCHFQVLMGSLAEFLSTSPERVDLWAGDNRKKIRLSPIVSPHDLAFSHGLTIYVRVRKLDAAKRNLNAADSAENRIPGTTWIQSFPIKELRIGLPASPKPLKNCTKSLNLRSP